MPSTVEVRTFVDIQNEILRRGKIASSTTTVNAQDLTAIKSFINSRYDEIAFSRKWNWREDSRLLTTIAKYDTGTADVTNGQRRVTLSAAATVTDNFLGRYFKVNGDSEYYEIISVSSTASRTLELATPYVGTTSATASYTIFKNKYGVWPDFADVYSIKAFGSLGGNELAPLETEEMGSYQAQLQLLESTYPTHYSIGDKLMYDGPTMGNNFIMGYDFMGGADTSELSLVLWPMVTASNVLEVKYGVQIIKLTDDTDEPLMPREKRIVLVYGALADWFGMQRVETAQAIWETKYNSYLAKMKADFDPSTSRVQLVAERPSRVRVRGRPIIFNQVS